MVALRLAAVTLTVAALVLGGTFAGSVRYTGFLGCRFAREVCLLDEECVDDGLFGNCQTLGRVKDSYQYDVDPATYENLEEAITELVGSGYTWGDGFTQCVLGNILLSFRRGMEPDPNFCGSGGIGRDALAGALSDESARILKQYLENYYDGPEETLNDDADYEYSDIPTKKDEFVNIHKYFKDDDDKRDNLGYNAPLDVVSELLARKYQGGSPEMEEENPLDNRLDDLLSELSPDDLAALQYFLENPDVSSVEEAGDNIEPEVAPALPDYSDYSPDGMSEQQFLESPPDYIPAADYEPPAADYVESQPEYFEEPSPDETPVQMDYAEPESDYPEPSVEDYNEPIATTDILDTVESEAADALLQPGDAGGDRVLLSPEDAKLLSDLINDKVDVDDLSDDDIQRLLTYVDDMINDVKDGKKNPEPDVTVLKEENVKRNEDAVAVVNKEQLGTSVLSNPSGNARIRVVSVPNNKRSDVSSKVNAPGYKYSDDTPVDPHDHSFENSAHNDHTNGPKLEEVHANYAYVQVKPPLNDWDRAVNFVKGLGKVLDLPEDALMFYSVEHGDITFYMNPKYPTLNATQIARLIMTDSDAVKNATGFDVYNAGIGRETRVSVTSVLNKYGSRYIVLTFVLCGCIAGIVLAVIALYIIRQHRQSKEKVAQLSGAGDGNEASKDYQDLCRQRMQSKSSDKPEPLNAASRVGSVSASEKDFKSPSSRSSTSSWSEEPVQSNMDISTGHIVLSYMEDHLKNKDRLDQEWEGLVAYEAEPSSTGTGGDAPNVRKNRYSDILPYDHSRVVLSNATNVSGSDYINASTITDHDPRNPAYIATQGPLPHTVADFWQMIWEQGSVVIVMLSKLTENGVAMCHRYWPEEGSDLYHIYEVHLVSEHIWCDDYLVRSFYLKNLQTNETRTVTQFHYLTWPDLGIPGSVKTLLDFRRKVNKSYRGRSCPIVVHCSDGSGRTGTYTLVDMVLNRLSKGAKEIDIAATLEHIRDQRMNMVKTKEQFEFALASVAEEVHAILKALPQ